MNISTLELQASFIADNMKSGLTFEESLSKSFNQVNLFLNEMNNSEFFKHVVFESSKRIINIKK